MTRFTLLLHLPRMTDHGHEARVKNGPFALLVALTIPLGGSWQNHASSKSSIALRASYS
jgi:hypothetical protein